MTYFSNLELKLCSCPEINRPLNAAHYSKHIGKCLRLYFLTVAIGLWYHRCWSCSFRGILYLQTHLNLWILRFMVGQYCSLPVSTFIFFLHFPAVTFRNSLLSLSSKRYILTLVLPVFIDRHCIIYVSKQSHQFGRA